MTAPVTSLKPLSFPLHGTRLIEASAGTGKTYTLAALYVRLVLGHGQPDQRFTRALAPAEILVVTFTNAATAELRDRIRKRLVAAAQVFRGQRRPGEEDEFLRGLLEYYEPEEYAHCAAVLDLAAQGMDEAAIFTIHGWCQRMLSEHAFYSGLSFNESLDDEASDLELQVARDYWRTFLYDLTDTSSLSSLPGVANSPEALLSLVRSGLQPDKGTLHYAGEPLPEPLQPVEVLPEYRAWLNRVETLWAELQAANSGDACALLHDAITNGYLKKTSYKSDAWTHEHQHWQTWLADPERHHWRDEPIQRLLAKFCQSKLDYHTKKNQPRTQHALFERFDAFLEALDQEPNLLPPVLAHAINWIGTEVQRRKRQQAQLSFDDLLTRLHQALHEPGGEALAARIRRQFPVAMVDEFQDTDPIQYGILTAVYPDVASTETALVLVGDPKQAIYSFRGADLHTYLAARATTEGRHYQLDTNFRSTPSMVAATNLLFSKAEKKSNGAFGFKTERENPLPFIAVKDNKKSKALQIDGANISAIHYWLAEGPPESLKKDDYLSQMAARCAQQIQHVLAHGQVVSQNPDDTPSVSSIAPGDIAILVRNRTEADRVRQALSALGLSSVYLSDKDSIFQSTEAELLLTWLRAIYNPEDESLLRAALTLPQSQQSDDDLLQLLENERQWEQLTDHVRQWQWQWRRQGVLPMLRAWLHALHLPGKWLAAPGGERSLTNVLHLAELLQTQSQQLDGEAGLLRWLATQMETASANEEWVLRLESDAKLIQVVTMHKSKGLQYPLVFLPFVCSFRETSSSHPLRYRTNGQWVLDLKPERDSVAQADQDRLQEDVRLLYVALTRSIYACWLGLGAYSVGRSKTSALHKSALGYLLSLDGGATANDVSAAAEALEWQHAPTLPSEDTPVATPVSRQGAQRLSHASLHRERWWIASYSALGTGRYDEAPETPQDAKWRDEQDFQHTGTEDEATANPARDSRATGLHGFPRGAQAGTFLHGLLEVACPSGFSTDALDDVLYPRLRQRGWEAEHDAVIQWWQTLVNSPLQSGGALNELVGPWPEMEFWLATHRVQANRLDQLVQQHLWPDLKRPPLLPDQLNGLLKGFMDLVYQAPDGRFWVLDYKSNWLGKSDADYTPEAMQAAMLSKRYDVQGALYLLALHRLLKARQPGYREDPSRWLGGALFWFIRAPERGQITLPASLTLLDALDQLFAGEVTDAA